VALIISQKIRIKLANKVPAVSQTEIEQCFATRDRSFLEDTRENNRTLPPTQWFISDTFMGRLLKIVFIQYSDNSIIIKTAYDPDENEKRVYQKYSTPI
jgi:hypothetical protein